MKLYTKNCMIKSDDTTLIGTAESIAESIKSGDLYYACFEMEQMFLATIERLDREGCPFELTDVEKTEHEIEEWEKQGCPIDISDEELASMTGRVLEMIKNRKKEV